MKKKLIIMKMKYLKIFIYLFFSQLIIKWTFFVIFHHSSNIHMFQFHWNLMKNKKIISYIENIDLDMKIWKWFDVYTNKSTESENIFHIKEHWLMIKHFFIHFISKGKKKIFDWSQETFLFRFIHQYSSDHFLCPLSKQWRKGKECNSTLI